ncbi:hypothetical protein OH76DRAFT_511360 [Lentinus brumalis]|uniref:F-box domain-containing protein n=1 Tax=Lentinus brumalis TaxID=2498619 RepID=A0A371DB43_9APHY|nr:hypothetical protein OH76DRAFT_511360 [Polyporus brumalis]
MNERMDSTPKESTGTPPPALNYDVLLNVITQSRSLQTSLAIVSTCRVLYHDGARILLGKPITLSTEPGLRSFLYFLRSAPLSRPQHLRDLSLHMSDIQPKLARRLGRICPSMTGLESLSMWFPERILASDPGLVAGLAKLDSLTRLSLSCSGTLVCTLLRLLHAPLKIISLSWGYDDFSPPGRIYWETVDEDDWPEHHPTILLENFANTLEELTCQWWYTGEEYIRPRKTFPRLQRLSIEHVDSVYVAPYVQAFPNLAQVSVLTYIEENMSCDEVDEDLEENHELNVSRQLLPASVHGGTWEYMEEFEGSFVDFYVLGFACHIPRLNLDAQSSDLYLPFLAETLSHTRPTYLKFTTYSNNDCDGLQWLSAALREMSPQAQSSLETIEAQYVFERSVPNVDLAAAMEEFASAIEEINIGALNLTIVANTRPDFTHGDWAVWNSATDSASVLPAAKRRSEHTAAKVPRKPPPPLTAKERMMEDFDVAQYTRRLVEALQTLRDVEIVIERPRQRGRRVATLARDGSRTVECLDYEE